MLKSVVILKVCPIQEYPLIHWITVWILTHNQCLQAFNIRILIDVKVKPLFASREESNIDSYLPPYIIRTGIIV